ncbi:MAG: NAD(P)/FAD-dependent oxidoreductase [Leptospirales bacterium]|nr:NAD(P)/FAD-dependent oxidoreductase [Leptospirales bacterium]
MFDILFEPIKINKTVIKNRIVYPSIALRYTGEDDINARYIEYFRERAKGGAGIVTVGPILFDDTGMGFPAMSIAEEESIPSFKKISSAIKNEGAKAWMQLYHAGAYGSSEMMNGKQLIAPSPIYSIYSKETPREMTVEEIHTIQDRFALGAERAKDAGFEGVELIGSAGYLITQFLSPLKNIRTDEYGGSFDNRVRFVREIIEKIRKRLGPDFPISIRMAGNDFVAGSNTDLDTPLIAKVYEEAGINAISVTGGWHESHVPQLTMELPRGGFSYLARSIKSAVSIPVYASNRISDPYTAEEIIKNGSADMVNLGRVLIADPYWPQKVKAGLIDEICPCIACSQGCTDEFFSGRAVKCLTNARASFERERNIPKTESHKKIMVIGAGPGGLEAAYRAAEGGYKVELFEKSDKIGGQLLIAGIPPYKQELFELVRFYNAMIKKFKIELHLNCEVTIELINKLKPDFIISAEGAVIAKPPIDGLDDKDNDVLSAWDVLKDDPKLGKEIAIIGGGAVGLETAEYIAKKGTIDPETLYFLFKNMAESYERLHDLLRDSNKKITVFEMNSKIGDDIGRSTKWILLGNIKYYNINLITGAKVLSIKSKTILYEKDGVEQSKKFDTVINAAGAVPVRKLAERLNETGIPFKVVGDSNRPAAILQAVHEGFLAVMDLEKT